MNHFTMRFLTISSLCLGTLLINSIVHARAPQQEKATIAAKEKAAITAADAWLSLVDAGKYAESWNEAAGYLKNAVTQEKMVQAMNGVRKPLGKMISRKVKSAKYKTSLPGAPDGEYVVIRFETSFENKKSAIETVTPVLEKDGQWKVDGYYIR